MERTDQVVNLAEYKVGHLPTIFYVPDFITDSEQTQLLHHEAWYMRRDYFLRLEVPIQLQLIDDKNFYLKDNCTGQISTVPSWLTKITERISDKSGLFPSPINHVLINEYLPDQGIMPHQDGPAYFPVVAIVSLGSPVVINFSPHPRLEESSSKDKFMIEDSTSDTNDTSMSLDTPEPIDSCSVILKPRSLLIFKDAAYADYLHGIEDSNVHKLQKVLNLDAEEHSVLSRCSATNNREKIEGTDEACNLLQRTSTRISLTCRLVLKVHKNLFRF